MFQEDAAYILRCIILMHNAGISIQNYRVVGKEDHLQIRDEEGVQIRLIFKLLP